MNCYGLIGFPLTHSFSKRYFTEKFEKMGISDTHHYELFELQDYTQLPQLIQNQPDLRGLNVTIPHKQNVLPYLDEITNEARRIGAVNVLKITNDKRLIGYNSDYYGFRLALEELLPANYNGIKALVLGNGGAAKAVKVALEDMGILYETVTRKPEENTILYADVKDCISDNQLLINTTPLGTSPAVDTCPALPYERLTEKHYLFDLVYNPETTLFMQKGLDKGAAVKNGYRMLVLQAEKSWKIWNQ